MAAIDATVNASGEVRKAPSPATRLTVQEARWMVLTGTAAAYDRTHFALVFRDLGMLGEFMKSKA